MSNKLKGQLSILGFPANFKAKQDILFLFTFGGSFDTFSYKSMLE